MPSFVLFASASSDSRPGSDFKLCFCANFLWTSWFSCEVEVHSTASCCYYWQTNFWLRRLIVARKLIFKLGLPGEAVANNVNDILQTVTNTRIAKNVGAFNIEGQRLFASHVVQTSPAFCCLSIAGYKLWGGGSQILQKKETVFKCSDRSMQMYVKRKIAWVGEK